MTLNRKTLIVGNWKMHFSVHQASLHVHRLNEHIKTHRDIEVVLAPSMLTLQPVSQQVDRRKFKLAAQDAYPVDEGAYTGEVSFAMLDGIADYCIVGHSARRIYAKESLEMIRDKVQAAVRNGIRPIICVGETKQERDAGETKQVLHEQITTALANITSRDIEDVVIAYEPVWAISTFNHIEAAPADVAKSVAYVRSQVEDLYGQRAAERMYVLYGGSANSHDARGYLEVPGVDGLLPGAASLNYKEFAAMIEVAYAWRTEA